MKAQQEEATQETERRWRQEMEKEKEQQKQDKAEKEMVRQTARSEMKVGFGRYQGRTCESITRKIAADREWEN